MLLPDQNHSGQLFGGGGTEVSAWAHTGGA